MKDRNINREVKKAFSEELALRMNNKKVFSRKEIKRAFSSENTQEAIKLYKKIIKDKKTREQTVAFIRAVDGQKIRNTSEV